VYLARSRGTCWADVKQEHADRRCNECRVSQMMADCAWLVTAVSGSAMAAGFEALPE
jgi:hypothetical protein